MSLLLGSTAASQSSSCGLNATVRIGQSPADVVVVTVPAGSVATIGLANDLQLEFTAPAANAKEQQTTARLLRRSGAVAHALHTTRQGGEVGFPRSNGYLVCQVGATFMSPAPELLPDCDDWSQIYRGCG
jgi:hypothetical protein